MPVLQQRVERVWFWIPFQCLKMKPLMFSESSAVLNSKALQSCQYI